MAELATDKVALTKPCIDGLKPKDQSYLVPSCKIRRT